MAAYTTKLFTSPQDIRAIAGAWNELRQRQPRPELKLHPEWLLHRTRWQTKSGMTVVALYDGRTLVGVAPFVLQPWTWACRFAYARVMNFPVRRADLCGETLLAPDDPAAYDAIFKVLIGTTLPYDMIFLEALPTDSRLWRAVRESPIVRSALWLYAPKSPEPHWFIRLPVDFDAYLAKFSGKRRRTLQYGVRYLEKRADAPIRVERIAAPEQIPSFLKYVARVSSLSWQGRRLQHAVQADGVERAHFSAYAEQGWFRSYLLMCGPHCIAFAIGAQCDGVYYYERIGYDPAWASYSPGSVLLYRIIEDLYAHQRPEWFDFGSGDIEYKRVYGNECVEAVNVYLLRRSAYMGLARTMNRSLTAVEGLLRRSVNRLGIRSTVLQLLRHGGVGSDRAGSDRSSAQSMPHDRDDNGSAT